MEKNLLFSKKANDRQSSTRSIFVFVTFEVLDSAEYNTKLCCGVPHLKIAYP